MKHKWIFILLLYLFASCNSDNNEMSGDLNFKVYKIVGGQHFSDNNYYYEISPINQLNFIVVFDESAVYNTSNSVNQLDINKLYGFSDGNVYHHQNSARIGWRWFDNELQIFAYCYNNFERTYEYITSVPLNEQVNCSISILEQEYVFSVNNVLVRMPRSAQIPSGYKLYPYFGGDEVAPHDIIIRIKDI